MTWSQAAWVLTVLAIACFTVGGFLLKFGATDDHEAGGVGVLSAGGVLGIIAGITFVIS